MKSFYVCDHGPFFSLFLFAQMPEWRKGMPNLGRIYGKLVDSTGKAIGDCFGYPASKQV
jgi:hypothetical protein